MAYWVLKILLTPVLRLVFRIRSEGTRHVPRRGPAILASNHRSFIDSVFLPLVVHRRVTFVARAEYFESWKTAWFFRAVGMIPLKRGDGSASERALAAAREVLDKGGVLGIYPEGTRSPDGRLYRGHTGVARLALESGAPVIPMAMVGTFELMPSGRLWPRLRFRPGVRFGKPLDFSRYAGLKSDLLVLRAVTDEIMYALMELSGQEYVDEYAQQAKSRLRGGRRLAPPPRRAGPAPAPVPEGRAAAGRPGVPSGSGADGP